MSKKGGGHHGGAWKVAYADFITALMALFMVLWISSQDEEILLATAGYFQNPFNSPNSRQRVANQGKDTEWALGFILHRFNFIVQDFLQLVGLDLSVDNRAQSIAQEIDPSLIA